MLEMYARVPPLDYLIPICIIENLSFFFPTPGQPFAIHVFSVIPVNQNIPKLCENNTLIWQPEDTNNSFA